MRYTITARAAALGALCLCSGCATWNKSSTPTAGPSISQQRQTRREEALAEYDRKRDDAQYQAAQTRCRQGDLDGSRDTLLKLVQRNPDYVPARLLISEILLMQGSPREALEQAEAAFTKHPDDAAAHHQMGVVLDALGRTEEAREHYHQALELQPDNGVYQLSVRAVEDDSYTAEVGSNEPKESLSAPHQRTNSAIAPVVHVAPSAAHRLPGDLADHAADMKAARTAGGRKSAAIPAAQAVGYAESVDRPESKSSSNPEAALSVAMSALRQGQTVEAAQLAQAGLRDYPDQAALYRVLGTAFYRLEEYSRAETALRKAISLDKSNASTYFLLGCVLDKLDQSSAAQEFYQQACRLDPKYSPPSDNRVSRSARHASTADDGSSRSDLRLASGLGDRLGG